MIGSPAPAPSVRGPGPLPFGSSGASTPCREVIGSPAPAPSVRGPGPLPFGSSGASTPCRAVVSASREASTVPVHGVLSLCLGLSGLAIAGCGLTLDYDPPDLHGTIDGAAADGGARDGGALDGGAIDGGAIDGGPGAPCMGAEDGDDCSSGMGPERLICIGGRCEPSRCGDGYVDPAREDCDPLVESGCDAITCRYECRVDADCGPSLTCASVTCTGHQCVGLPRGNGTPCTLDDGTTGECGGGLCVAVGCGNGILDDGEDCDPGATSIVGCHGCLFDCHGADECSDRDACNGVESCDPVFGPVGDLVGHVCAPAATIPRCPPAAACFRSDCSTATTGAMQCTEVLLDADGDGFAPLPLVCDGGVGGDCDDADPTRHPGAPEACNSLDDDCDGLVDDDTVAVTWCRDDDGDGFGRTGTETTTCASPGTGYVRNCLDCYDVADPALRAEAALVHPGQTTFFTTPYCDSLGVCSFDYDCDQVASQQVATVVQCGLLGLLLCSSGVGWHGSVPPCGAPGTLDTCHTPLFGLVCRTTSAPQTQACR